MACDIKTKNRQKKKKKQTTMYLVHKLSYFLSLSTGNDPA